MSTVDIKQKRDEVTDSLKDCLMKIVAFADICRDAGKEAEYQEATTLFESVNKTMLG